MIETYLLVGVGFTGAFTLLFFFRWVHRQLFTQPSVQAWFSPKGGCTGIIVSELQRARHEILVQAYSFTCADIAQALIDAKKRGVRITILLDRSNEKETYSELKMLSEHDVWPLIDANHAIAHNKIMIIDKRTLVTGSFNFTRQAEHENAENLLVIRGHWELIESYRKNFHAHQEHSQAPGAVKVADHMRKQKAA
jgi:phosphatidylserine/phosphatidylglycerophosphate/cardiolipin synthase-like enzyme